ncbi:MAG TPA: phosphatase PAP2 family protein [Candidatus Dormibacteraeota bacterium]
MPSRSRNALAGAVNVPLFVTGLIAALGTAGLALYLSFNRLVPGDVAVERAIQSVQWGPLNIAFDFFNWIGDAKGFALELAVFLVVIAYNHRAWLIAAGASLTACWYFFLTNLIIRARPTVPEVLRVTVHPGASSFPSGHTIFICTLMATLVLCLGYRFIRGWGRAVAWAVAAGVIAANDIGRIYSGAHWPSDVLAGMLIATAWLCLWLSVRLVFERIYSPSRSSSTARVASRDFQPS